MRCREIIEILEELAPPFMACDWDNPGLLAGRSDKEIKRILLALDATDAVVKEAAETESDLLLTHHPLIFKPIKKINDGDFIGRRLLSLIQHDISYFAMHTNFDSAPGCMGKLAADRLGLKEQKVLEVLGVDERNAEKKEEYGVGVYGTLEEEKTVRELAEQVKQAYQIPFVTVFGDENKRVKHAAVCPGAGGSTIKEALKKQADVYITGDIGHHDGIDAVADGMAVIDAGHYGIEHIFMEFMERYLRERLPKEIEIKRAADAFPNYVI